MNTLCSIRISFNNDNVENDKQQSIKSVTEQNLFKMYLFEPALISLTETSLYHMSIIKKKKTNK